MDDPNKSVFARLDGPTAHILVIVGLLLMLLSPLITQFKLAGLNRATVVADQNDKLARLDLQELSEQQDDERKKDVDANTSPTDLQSRDKERAQKMTQLQQEVKKRYPAVVSERQKLDARADFAGTRTNLIASFLGALCLLIGLIVMTVQSEGARQKVLLIILLVVMFSALSGINLSLKGESNLGRGPDPVRTMMEAPAPQGPSSRP